MVDFLFNRILPNGQLLLTTTALGQLRCNFFFFLCSYELTLLAPRIRQRPRCLFLGRGARVTLEHILGLERRGDCQIGSGLILILSPSAHSRGFV